MFTEEFYRFAKFHHLGLAVKDFTSAISFLEGIGYQCSRPIKDNSQSVELIMCISEHFPDIELIKPADNRSPVSNLLEKNNEGIYHICFEVKSMGKVLDIISKTNRIICVSRPKKAVLFGEKAVSFYYVKGVGLIEFLEK